MERHHTQGTLTLETLGESARRLLAQLERRANGKKAPRGPRLRLVAANDGKAGTEPRVARAHAPAVAAAREEESDGLDFDELWDSADADDEW